MKININVQPKGHSYMMCQYEITMQSVGHMICLKSELKLNSTLNIDITSAALLIVILPFCSVNFRIIMKFQQCKSVSV